MPNFGRFGADVGTGCTHLVGLPVGVRGLDNEPETEAELIRKGRLLDQTPEFGFFFWRLGFMLLRLLYHF